MTPATAALLDAAAESCARSGTRLTEIRRRVLALIVEASGPLGAYALLDQLKAERANATPVTIYRALDFLLAAGLIHRLERLNAFVACRESADHPHAHAAHFLICRECGRVEEFEDHRTSEAILALCNQAGFQPSRATVEVEGRCERCTQTGQETGALEVF